MFLTLDDLETVLGRLNIKEGEAILVVPPDLEREAFMLAEHYFVANKPVSITVYVDNYLPKEQWYLKPKGKENIKETWKNKQYTHAGRLEMKSQPKQ